MTLLSSAAVRYQHRFGQDKHHWAFGCYLLLYNFIQQRLGSDTAMNSLPAAIPERYRPPLKTNAPASLQLLGRFRRTDFARQFTALLVRCSEKLCRADHFIFGSLVGKKLWSSLLHLLRRSTGFVNSPLTLPARLLWLV